jgi:glycosyltransferase involved in cell wall biosynthesis
MKIETYILAHQEEKIIGYTMKHYTQFSDVILMEGHSTDRTVEIAQHYGAKIMKVDTNNQVNDEVYLQLKNNVWKESKADWVIIADCDEFVYLPNLKVYLENTLAQVIMPRLFNMMSETFPTTKGQIYEEIQYGREGGAKINLFNPSFVKEINYAIGCHHADPIDKFGYKIAPDVQSPILTFHMRHLSRQYTMDKNKYLYSRLSDINKLHNWGYHLAATNEEYNRWFNNEMTALIKVI